MSSETQTNPRTLTYLICRVITGNRLNLSSRFKKGQPLDKLKRDTFLAWAKFLHPKSLKGNLIAASLFLAAYETLRASVIEQIQSFFTFGFDQNDAHRDDAYRLNVLALDKSPLRASFLWLKENNVIDEVDMKSVDDIRKHRNELAHDLRKFITTVEAEINVQLLGRICELVTKIDRWWILSVEIPSNPDFDSQEVDAAGVHSGHMIFLRIDD